MHRSLASLSKNGSTSRVLNLHRVWEMSCADADHGEKPFFRDRFLNRSILVKHRIRPDESYLFGTGKSVATKIIFPFDRTELRVGGQSLFVGQSGYKIGLQEMLGSGEDILRHDLEVLALLDQLPSLDPFLTREHLRRHDVRPADCYFGISEADSTRMLSFAAAEISDLIQLAVGKGQELPGEFVQKLAEALLSTHADQRLDPLRATLGLAPGQFRDGVFSWKGFIYYKWQFHNMVGDLSATSTELDLVRIIGKSDRAQKRRIEELKTELRKAIRGVSRDCRVALGLYDKAFRDLVDRGNASAFRQFLLEAPALFMELGQAMGNVSHVCSYWRFRFPKDTPHQIQPGEYIDLLQDFANSLSPQTRVTEQAWT